ncbi:MAG: ABC transporter permease subunit [Clostridiales bacterium]|nr:ABC transporter permease subunit [Clostridiales bacterium]
MTAVFKREFRAYFTGPIGYIFCAAFFSAISFSFYLDNVSAYRSDFSTIFNIMMLWLILLVPLMTMRLWSEEKRQKTDQLLLTAPVGTMEIVLGKFFSALCVFLCALSLTFIYPIIVSLFGTPEVKSIIGNYVAITFAASAYIAISLFISSLTESQIVSAILSIISLSLFLAMNVIFESTNIEFLAKALGFLSMITRYFNFFQGLFSLSDVFYFISLTVIFLFLTSRVIEKRRWS